MKMHKNQTQFKNRLEDRHLITVV